VIRYLRTALVIACIGASFGFGLAWLAGGVLPNSREATFFMTVLGAALTLVSWPLVFAVEWLLGRARVGVRTWIARVAAIAIALVALTVASLGARRAIALGSVADIGEDFASQPATMTPKTLGIPTGPHESDGLCEIDVDAAPWKLVAPHACAGLLVWRDAKRDAWLVSHALSSGAVVEDWSFVGPSFERRLGWRRAFARVAGPPWGFVGFAIIGVVLAAVVLARGRGDRASASRAVAIIAFTAAPMMAAAIHGFCV
jgi:hypothetical protein